MHKLQYTCIPKINKTVNKSYISVKSISTDLTIKSNKQTITNIASSLQTEELNSASGSNTNKIKSGKAKIFHLRRMIPLMIGCWVLKKVGNILASLCT